MDETKVVIEEFESSSKRHEIHIYTKNEDEWLGGMNPEFISKASVKRLLRENKLRVVGYRKKKK